MRASGFFKYMLPVLWLVEVLACGGGTETIAKRHLPPVDSVGPKQVTFRELPLFKVLSLGSKTVKWIDDEGPALDVLPDSSDHSDIIRFRTPRDCYGLIPDLVSLLGKDSILVSKEQYGLIGHVHWIKKSFLNKRDIEICVHLEDHEAFFELEITAWDQYRVPVTMKEPFFSFFSGLLQSKILNKPVYLKKPLHFTYPRYYDFKEVINTNTNWVIEAVQDSLMEQENPYLTLDIDKYGELESIDYHGCENLKSKIHSFFEKINYPLVIHQRTQDTLSYHLSVELPVSDRLYRQWIQKKLEVETQNGHIHTYEIVPGKDTSYPSSILVGDLCRNGKRFGVAFKPDGKSAYFFDLQNNRVVLNSALTDLPIWNGQFIFTDDLDKDGLDEVITATAPNMNGNQWMNIFHFDKIKGTFYYAGTFTTDYEINSKTREIETNYIGSWYMPQIKTLYGWKKGRLIRKYEETSELIEYYGDWFERRRSVYYNPLFKEGKYDNVLVRQYREPMEGTVNVARKKKLTIR